MMYWGFIFGIFGISLIKNTNINERIEENKFILNFRLFILYLRSYQCF